MWTGHAAEWQDNRIYPILYLNIRIARERKACGALLYKQLWREQEPENTLLLSAPGNGKTTLLRDLIRLWVPESGRDDAVNTQYGA